MKKLVLLLVLPVALFAQVEVDTIIRLDHRLKSDHHYIPELNKLYLETGSHIIALDCSTWQVTAEFPFPTYTNVEYAWNPVRRKLYVTYHIFDSTLVVFPDADTAHWIPVGFHIGHAYVGSRDLLYGRLVDTLYPEELRVLDCSTDTVVKVIETPVPGCGLYSVSWDSVADRVFVVVSAWGAPPQMAVYDVKTDSLLALFPTTARPSQLLFHHPLRKAYFVGNGPGVIDTDGLRLIKLFPFSAWATKGHGPVAVNSLMDKVYFGGHINRRTGTCTLFVVDAFTDSIIKGVAFQGTYPQNLYVVWVPWSNRVYFRPGPHMAVLDCETDSIIVPELVLPGQTRGAIRLLLDPVRERIFAIGADTNTIHVLRDVPYGIEEPPDKRPTFAPRGPTVVRGVLSLPRDPGAGHNPILPGESGLCPKPTALLLDATGRKVMDLTPGENDVRHLAPGVYFIRARGPRGQGFEGQSAKVVIQR